METSYHDVMATQDLGAFIMVGLALILFAICCLVLLLLKHRNRRFLPYNPLTERRVRISLLPIQEQESSMSHELVTLPDGNELGRLVRQALEASELPDTGVNTFINRLSASVAGQEMTSEAFAGVLVDRFGSSVPHIPRDDTQNILTRIVRQVVDGGAAQQSAVARIMHAS